MVCCALKEACFFYYYELLRCGIVTNLRNCFLSELPLRMFLMSVTSVFRTDFYIEEREGEGILSGAL